MRWYVYFNHIFDVLDITLKLYNFSAKYSK